MSRPRVLVLASEALFAHFFAPAALERLAAVAEWSRDASREDSESLRAALAGSDALLTTWHSPYLRGEMLGAQPRVRLVAHAGGEVMSRMDMDVFDRVTVTNAAEPMAEPVAEMALALTLSLVRQIPRYAREMCAGVDRPNDTASVGETVRSRRVGVVGFGRIGRAFARLVAPLGAELVVHDPHCAAADVEAAGSRATGLDELLASCSVVVLAAGLTDDTRGMLDARRLASIRDGACLVNVARGGLVDLEALVAELRSGRISAALDVTDPLEPLPRDHELRRLPNVLLTPHVAAGGVETRRAMGEVAVDEVVRFLGGEPPRNLVTREMLKTMT
jgi:phosphoglycerate dehydrogenase-like enzyme